jgi:hypothetical protein
MAETAQIVPVPRNIRAFSPGTRRAPPKNDDGSIGPPQRVLLAETSRDIANIAAGAMVFGQFLGERPFSRSIALTGVVVWICLVIFSVSLIGRKQP